MACPPPSPSLFLDFVKNLIWGLDLNELIHKEIIVFFPLNHMRSRTHNIIFINIIPNNLLKIEEIQSTIAEYQCQGQEFLTGDGGKPVKMFHL